MQMSHDSDKVTLNSEAATAHMGKAYLRRQYPPRGHLLLLPMCAQWRYQLRVLDAETDTRSNYIHSFF